MFMQTFFEQLDEVWDIEDPVQRADYFYSGIPVRRPGSAALPGASPLTVGLRARIRKLLGENDGSTHSGN
jgi:hypothetical protein